MRNCRRTIIFALSAALLLILDNNIRIIRLTTESAPYRYCLHLGRVFPEEGDLCVFRRNGRTIVKYLMGLEGDQVRNINSTICVNVRKVGEAKRRVKEGVVPKGCVFVAGASENSFDSRYEEFGFVKASDIEGKAVGLW